MPASLVSALGYILAAVLAGLAVYYWRRSSGLYSLLVEGANRFEELRQRGAQLEQSLAKEADKLKIQREQTQRLEKGVDDAREKAAELVRRLEAKEHELKIVTEKLELQKGHLEKQLVKADERLRVADVVQGELQLKLSRLSGEAEQRFAVARQEAQIREGDLKARVRDLEAKLREADKDREQLDKRAKIMDPAELKRIKRKLSQYDRLYSGMKGQREMVEERNRNWEVALRRLSAWILRETGGPLANVPEAIGPLVGQALSAIGAQLVDDEEGGLRRPGHGAERADDMDDPTAFADADLEADAEANAAHEAALHPERALAKVSPT